MALKYTQRAFVMIFNTHTIDASIDIDAAEAEVELDQLDHTRARHKSRALWDGEHGRVSFATRSKSMGVSIEMAVAPRACASDKRSLLSEPNACSKSVRSW
jgi:hypothetical protein